MNSIFEEEQTFDSVLRDLVEAAMDGDNLRLQRKGEMVVVTDAVWVVMGPERDLWPALRHIPSQLPAEEGAWKFTFAHDWERGDFWDAKPLLPTLEIKDRPTVPIHRTNLLVEHEEKNYCGLVRAFGISNRYLFVDERFAPLLKWCKHLWLTTLTWNEEGTGPIWGQHSKDVRVMVLPVMVDSIATRYLRPFDTVQ